MKTHLTAVLLLAGLTPALTWAQERAARDAVAPDVNAIKVEKVKDNIYLLSGGGGNSTVFVTSKGVVVIDTKNPGWGAPLIAKIKTLTDKPVTTIINTHTHPDHVSGNVEFPATVDVVTQENTAALMAEMRPSVSEAARGSKPIQVFKLNGNRNLPKHTYKDKLSIGSGDDRIDLYYFGPAHTGGDTFVVIPAARVMVTGDVFSNKGLPNIDANNGGSAIGLTNVLAKASAMTDIDTVIPGHIGEVLPFSDLKQYAEFNRDFMNWAKQEMQAGKTVDQAAAEYKIPERYKDYPASQPDRIKVDLQQYYDEFRKAGGAN
jgi:glyoxylase-like metal-dependent hydrolase (beta-lactamase superfamily II)